jgi:hypothetical protein
MPPDKLLTAESLAEMVRKGGKTHPSNADSGSFRHIYRLKVGDKLRFIGGPQSIPKRGEVVKVFSVMEDELRHTDEEKKGVQVLRYDFTALFDCRDEDGEYLLEYLQDSRYYERVTK